MHRTQEDIHVEFAQPKAGLHQWDAEQPASGSSTTHYQLERHSKEVVTPPKFTRELRRPQCWKIYAAYVGHRLFLWQLNVRARIYHLIHGYVHCTLCAVLLNAIQLVYWVSRACVVQCGQDDYTLSCNWRFASPCNLQKETIVAHCRLWQTQEAVRACFSSLYEEQSAGCAEG